MDEFSGRSSHPHAPVNPPTAKSLPSMTQTLMLARQDVMEGPADHVSVSKSKTSVVHKDWHPSDPPTTTNLSVEKVQTNFLS